MADETADKVIRSLLGIGLLLGVVLGIEMIAGAAWWSLHAFKVQPKGSSGFYLTNTAVSGGRTLLQQSPFVGWVLFILYFAGFILSMLTLGPRDFLKGRNFDWLLYAIGAAGLVLTGVATKVDSPPWPWDLTWAWAGAAIGWAVYLLTLFGLLSTRRAALQLNTRPDSSDG